MKRILKMHYPVIQEFINAIKVGIFISDGQGNVLMINDESARTGGMSREELVGRNMKDLVQIGYVTESTTLKVLESLKEESLIQDMGVGGKMYVNGVPIMKNGKADMVVCTEQDVTETIRQKELLIEKEKIAEKYENELEYLRSERTSAERSIIGQSFEMRNVLELAMRVARRDVTVFLHGESGTGKELIANLIHQKSTRAHEAFIKINCAAIPENLLESELFGYEKGAFTGADKNGKAGLFELADKGTLFLDEIGDMSLTMQSKLLRVLQEQEVMRIGGNKVIHVDVRIVTATNLNLREAVSEGRFREDLYYRLNVVPIELPPLRNRKEDIVGLAWHFINQFNKAYKLNKVLNGDAVKYLENYTWPGNVRELRNIIERIMISFDGKEITRFQISNQLSQKSENEKRRVFHEHKGSLEERIAAYERELLMELMEEHRNGNKVAQILEVNKSTISRKLRKYGIE